MKKIATLSLSFLVMAVTLITFFAAYPKAQAEEFGTIVSDAVVLRSGTVVKTEWTNENTKEACYNTFTLTAKGYINFMASKPVLADGEKGAYIFTLYNEAGDVVWKADTTSQITTSSSSYVYKIGLDAGTYYMSIETKFVVSDGSVSANYRYTFYSSEYWEIENNNSPENAREIVFSKPYTGFFSEEIDSDACDYFAITLEEGYSYYVRFDKYAAFVAADTDMVFQVVSPDGTETTFLKNDGTVSGSATYWEYTALETGVYYVRLLNSSNKSGYEYKVSVVPIVVSANKVNVNLPKSTFPCSGDEIKPELSVSYSGYKLEEGDHYTVKYPSAIKNGTYNIVLTFDKGFSGQKLAPFKIIPPIDVSELDVRLSETTFRCDDEQKSPAVIAKYGSETLVENVHYTVEYPKAVTAGDYKAKVTFQKGYTGTATLAYKILPPIDASELDVQLSETVFDYDGKAKTPEVTVKHGDVTLVKDVNYTVNYVEAVTPGTYNVTLTFKKGYAGTRTLSYIINPVDASELTVSLSATSFTYDGTEKTPTVVAKYGDATLVKDTDYTVTYPSPCVNAGTYNVTVEFKGIYAGKKTLSFEIVEAPKNTSTITAKPSTGSIHLTWQKVKNATGYQVYQYNVHKGNYNLVANTKATNYKVSRLAPGTTYKFKVVAYQTQRHNWKINVLSTDEIITATKCTAPRFAKATTTTNSIKLTWTKVAGATGYIVYQYNPSTRKSDRIADVKDPTITITNNLKPGTNYKFAVKAYKKLSDGTIVNGDISKSYIVATKREFAQQPAPKFTNATATTNSIKLIWTKVEGATGYIIYQYNPSTGKSVRVADVKTTSCTINKNLKAGTGYKFAVKAYKKLSNGTIINGAVSKSFTAKTKCAAPEIESIAVSSKQKITIKWSEVEGATGYQVYYYTSNSNYKSIFTTTSNEVTNSLSRAVKGKKVNIRVRAYTKVNGQIVYSDWSDAEIVAVK